MTRKLEIIIAVLVLAAPISAHRHDEYLQAIIVSLVEDHIQASMRLIPGVAVSSDVIAAVDLNHDGVFSEVEQQAYAQKVLHDLSVCIDGQKLTPVLRSVTFPAAAEMKEGLGEIHIQFAADLPTGLSRRVLTIANHHQPRMSVYLMNCLLPQDSQIQVIAQNRSANQSYYRVDYVQSGNQDSLRSFWRSRALAALAPFGGVPSMFKLGSRHISEGTDHLLFLIALLLPAPLLSRRSHWGGVQQHSSQLDSNSASGNRVHYRPFDYARVRSIGTRIPARTTR